jgi:hypothetical protein
MERGATGDPSVLRRRVKSGTALFSPPTDEASRGLMVVVGDRSHYDLRLVERLTRKEFEDWEKVLHPTHHEFWISGAEWG